MQNWDQEASKESDKVALFHAFVFLALSNIRFFLWSFFLWALARVTSRDFYANIN